MIHFLYVNSVCDLDSLTVTHLAEKPVYVNPGSFEGVSIASKRRLDHNNRKMFAFCSSLVLQWAVELLCNELILFVSVYLEA